MYPQGKITQFYDELIVSGAHQYFQCVCIFIVLRWLRAFQFL